MREGVVVGLANHTVLIAEDDRSVHDESAAPIRDQGPDRRLVLVFRDVTGRRRLENRRPSRVGARGLAAMMNSSEDAVVSETLEAMIQTWNAAAEWVFG